MLHFTCTHCGKPIYGMAIILDKTHFLHDTCKIAFELTVNSLEELKSDEESNEVLKEV